MSVDVKTPSERAAAISDASIFAQPRRRLAATASGRRLFLALALAATIPVVIFGGAVMLLVAVEARSEAQTAAAVTVKHVAERVTAEIGNEIEVAQTLAALPSLDAPDLPTFYAQAQRIVPARALWDDVSLVNPEGRQLVEVEHRFGETLGPVVDRASFKEVVRTKRPVVGEISVVKPSGERERVYIAVPVLRDGSLRSVIMIELSLREIQSILQHAGAPKGWTGVILDPSDNLLARTDEVDDSSETAGNAVQSAPRLFEMASIEQTLPQAGNWTVRFGVPASELNGPVRQSLFLLAVGSLASVAFGGGLAHVVSQDLTQRRLEQERRAAFELTESEERCALAVDAAELGTWRLDPVVKKVTGSRRVWELLDLLEVASGPGAPVPYADFLASIHSDDRAAFRDAVRDCLAHSRTLDVEFRILRRNGESGWARAWGRGLPQPYDLRARAQAEAAEFHGVIANIQPQKRAESERTQLLKRLAVAQEREQSRIARELHDQVGQSVTALSLSLKSLERSVTAGPIEPAGLRDSISALRHLTGKIGEDVHRAAHDLRPVALDEVGLDQAVTALVADWRARSGLTIDLQILGLDRRLPSDVETAIYRIVQEALTNIVKHARARIASVVLERRTKELLIIVEDDGAGFDADAIAQRPEASPRGGLGLVSIRERLALLGGQLTFESAPDAGVTLFVRIPLESCNVEICA